MPDGNIVIERRFNGPPNSANGGYACGRVAAFVDGPAEVTLHSPPPLDTTMRVEVDDEVVEVYDREQHVATARPAVVPVELTPAPSFESAQRAEARTIPPEAHRLPTCFVCGPRRRHGDGLRIHVGPLDEGGDDWSGPLAATWVPDRSLADAAGRTGPEFVWAALDCPTGFAAGFADGVTSMLLGRQSVEISRTPEAGEHCVVVARRTGQDGRKLYADSILYGGDAAAIAWCRAVWIDVEHHVMVGDLR